MSSNIDKYIAGKAGGGITKSPDGKIRVGLPSLHSKVAAAQQQAASEIDSAQEMPQRIALMLDCSGSMQDRASGTTKIEALRGACEGFVDAVDFDTTSVAIATFPGEYEFDYGEQQNHARHPLKLTRSADALKLTIASLKASGGTPLDACMQRVVEGLSITRGVVVSDGEAGDMSIDCGLDRKINDEQEPGAADPGSSNAVAAYIAQGIPVDCVHIGLDRGGEDLLEWIARATGGVFIKFKDIASFGKALKYLSPRYRALLSAPGAAALLGADEVKG